MTALIECRWLYRDVSSQYGELLIYTVYAIMITLTPRGSLGLSHTLTENCIYDTDALHSNDIVDAYCVCIVALRSNPGPLREKKGRPMTAIEKTVRAYFDTRNPGEVVFYLPDRMPDADWATSAINTLRNVHDIDKLTCRPNSFELEALMAHSHDAAGLLAEIIMTVMELMGVDSAHKLAINVKRSLTSMTAEDLLVAALKQVAIREWSSAHSLTLGMARDGWTEIDQRIQALSAAEAAQAAEDERLEGELIGARDAFEGARRSYSESRHADLHDDGLLALGQVVTNFAKSVKELEETLESTRADLNATRQEHALFATLLEEAQTRIHGIEQLTCPRYKVITSKWGKVALFTLKSRLSQDVYMEGSPDGESHDHPNNATDMVSAEKA